MPCTFTGPPNTSKLTVDVTDAISNQPVKDVVNSREIPAKLRNTEKHPENSGKNEQTTVPSHQQTSFTLFGDPKDPYAELRRLEEEGEAKEKKKMEEEEEKINNLSPEEKRLRNERIKRQFFLENGLQTEEDLTKYLNDLTAQGIVPIYLSQQLEWNPLHHKFWTHPKSPQNNFQQMTHSLTTLTQPQNLMTTQK